MPATTYDCLTPDGRAQGIAAAAEALRGGDVVVLPTDTVYGIGADAFNNAAVAKLLATKKRGPDMPVPVLVGSWTTIQGLVREFSDTAKTLVEAFGPEGSPSLSRRRQACRGTWVTRVAQCCFACPTSRWRWSCCRKSARWQCPLQTSPDTRQQ